jgi:hypothetical protein
MDNDKEKKLILLARGYRGILRRESDCGETINIARHKIQG